ncbi:hypothetical protein AC579_9650 [Pseudocercospora musae]|uniref:NADH-ubiquinone oxidoreductase 9.5 kDa subunit n=1 Tax=Pseudocercospora musae TaxID=113226 RepID=A0A139IJU9_9PEZI|nr:hypothetical protein AC579_9650 [Pseudocercospora musae]
MAPVTFWQAPTQWMSYMVRKKPALFWSVVVGSVGPVALFTIPPIRYRLGDGPRPQIPLTYPIPKGPRQPPKGYDD